MSWLLNFPQPACVLMADGCVSTEGPPGAGEVGMTPEAGQSLSSAALTLLSLFLFRIEARTHPSPLVRFHSVIG